MKLELGKSAETVGWQAKSAKVRFISHAKWSISRTQTKLVSHAKIQIRETQNETESIFREIRNAFRI